MTVRTIMIFPEFKNMEIIDKIRNQYDPLANFVRPHITLVFPFKSPVSNEKLEQTLNMRLMPVKPFELKLGGISKQEDAFGNYLFLDVLQGMEELCGIHQILYENEFKKFDSGMPYVPHMTIGKFRNINLLENAFNDIKSMDNIFSTIVNKVSVEMIGSNEESIIVIEKALT